MAASAPRYYNAQGEINPVGSQLPPGLGGVMGSMGHMNPDRMLLNLLTGSPFGFEQARMGGRSPRLSDIMVHQQQEDFFKFGKDASNAQQRSILSGIYSGMGFQGGTLDSKVQNSMSMFNPAGMATHLAMLSYGEAGADRALTRGFLATNMYASRPEDADFASKQSMLRGFTNQVKGDFYNDANGYGGFNLQGVGEVFQQMGQRNMVGQDDIKNRSAKTSKDLKDMSQAVGSMQELFGGTIPELFDKMDAVFGGTAGGMGGQQLQGRILRMKQTSMITGQSLQATAQMMMTGQQYAMAGGADAGVGSAAAEQTGLAIGVNYSDDLSSVRRINSGRLQAATLRMNTAAATSKQAQYYAGAYQVYLDKNGLTASDANSAAFRGLAGGATDIGGLAAAAGGTAEAVRTMSMSGAARIAMADDRNVSRYATEQSANTVREAAIRATQAAAQRRGVNVGRASFVDSDGNLLGRDAIAANLQAAGLANASGVVDNQLRGIAKNYLGSGSNEEELEGYLVSARKADSIRKVRDKRAAADAAIGSKTGGLVGILDYLSDGGDTGKAASLGGVLGAAFGVTSGDELRDALGTADPEKLATIGTQAAGSLRTLYKGADKVLAGKIQTVANAMASGKLTGLSAKDRSRILSGAADGFNADEVDFAFSKLGSQKQQDASDILREGSFQTVDAYKKAINEGNLAGRQAAGRALAAENAIDSITDSTRSTQVQKALSGGFKSIADAREKLKGVDFGGRENRDAFLTELKNNAEALDAGDPALKIADVLTKLVDVLNTLASQRDKNKGTPGG